MQPMLFALVATFAAMRAALILSALVPATLRPGTRRDRRTTVGIHEA